MNALRDKHYYEEIRRQPSLEAAAQVLAECADGLGWDLAAFHADKDAVDLPRAKNGEFIAAIMGWPSESFHVWQRGGMGRDCPIASRCGRVTEPFYMNCDERDSSWFGNDLNVEQRKVLNHYGRYITGGLCIPVRLVNGSTGYVSWCSRGGDYQQRVQASLGTMFFVSHAFILHAESLLAAESDVAGRQLTARERQCLTWAARGKSEEEIAELIHRSRDTVHFHLRNAATKLDADNRTHAVAIACTRGLISLR